MNHISLPRRIPVCAPLAIPEQTVNKIREKSFFMCASKNSTYITNEMAKCLKARFFQESFLVTK
jgi:hypothetical protein